jgi:ornithine cyclodeaminase/alanine dehydrogenase-like protein (mu-crystallin family)
MISSEMLGKLLPMRSAIECLRVGYTGYELANCLRPPRTLIRVEAQDAVFGSMPIYSVVHDKYVAKLVSFNKGNYAKGLPSIHGVVVVQDGPTGCVEAIIDGGSLTALRTGATSGLATDLLAMKEIGDVAIIGTGMQALAQLEAVLSVRKAGRVLVYSRDKNNVQAFIDRSGAYIQGRCKVVAACSVVEAVSEADIICTATTSALPLFDSCNIRVGAHINAVGKHTTESREFPPEILERGVLLVEDRDAAVREAGGYNRGGIEIGEMLAMNYLELRSETTIFASVGTAFQDMCIAVELSKLMKSGG